jgi:hypothetical protein
MVDDPDMEVSARRPWRIHVVGWLVLSVLALLGATWDSQWVGIRILCVVAVVGCIWQALATLRSRGAVQDRP